MGDVVKFESPDPHSWTPEEALERALEVVREGKFEADKAYIALCRGPRDGSKEGGVYYTISGMQLPEAIGWLTMHIYTLMNDG